MSTRTHVLAAAAKATLGLPRERSEKSTDVQQLVLTIQHLTDAERLDHVVCTTPVHTHVPVKRICTRSFRVPHTMFRSFAILLAGLSPLELTMVLTLFMDTGMFVQFIQWSAKIPGS